MKNNIINKRNNVLNKEKCLSPYCSRPKICRGLCRSCYAMAIRYIKMGETSWEKLEKDGKIAKSKKGGQQKREKARWLLNLS